MLYEREIQRAVAYGARQAMLEGESDTLADAVKYTDRAIDALGGLRGKCKDELIELAHELKTELLVARCEVEERLSVYAKADDRADDAEHKRAI